MTEDSFDSRLQAMFETPPAFDDNLAFATVVEQRLSRAGRWRADGIVAAWIVAGAAVLWSLLTGLDSPAFSLAWSQISAPFDSLEVAGGVWLVPALVVGGVLMFQMFEDVWARD